MSNKESAEFRHQMCFEQHHETTPAEKVVGDVSAYRALVEETQKTSQCGRNETMAVHIDPVVEPQFDTLVADQVDKTKAPGVVIFFPHGNLNYSLASFTHQTGYTYSMGGAYPDGNLMRVVGYKGQSARELTDAVIKAGFMPFDQLPNVKYGFEAPAFDQLFNLKMIAKVMDATLTSDTTGGVTTYYVTFTTDYQLKGFLSFIEEAELAELAIASSRWDK